MQILESASPGSTAIFQGNAQGIDRLPVDSPGDMNGIPRLLSSTVEDHTKELAAYLSQSFYETVCRVCRPAGSGFPILGRIANLRYKSPTALVGRDELPQLVSELLRLGDVTGGSELLAAATVAIARPCSLTISGDMFPELVDCPSADAAPSRDHGPRQRCRPWWRFW